MGGVIEGGVGAVDITSPRKEAVERVQAEIRQEFDVRDIRQRELEFLEKGGNPLEYALVNAVSASVQSTSFVGRQPDRFNNSEVKRNFPLSASPHGDSLESSGRPGEAPREPNTADNLLLFDAEPVFSEGDQNLLQPSRSNREQGDPVTFSLPGKAYKRRNRSRRSTSNDPNSSRGNNGFSLTAQPKSRDVKGLESDSKPRNASLDWSSKPTNLVDDSPRETLLTKDVIPDVITDATLEAYTPKNRTDGKLEQGSPSAIKDPCHMDSVMADVKIKAAEEKTSPAVELHTNETAAMEIENQHRYRKMNGKREEGIASDGPRDLMSTSVKGLDLASSSTQADTSNVGNDDTRAKNISAGDIKNQNIASEGLQVSEIYRLNNKEKHPEGIGTSTVVKTEEDSTCLSQQDKLSSEPNEEFNFKNRTIDNVIDPAASVSTGSETGKKYTDPVRNNPDRENEAVLSVSQNEITSARDLVEAGSSNGVSTVVIDPLTSLESELKVKKKIDEDSILKEALIIQAKRKRIAELSVPAISTEIRQRAHWAYVLEEMAWMANDFAQERLWKKAAAAQLSSRAAFSYCLKRQEQESKVEVIEVAHKMARAVKEFWLSVDRKNEETKEELELQHQKYGAMSVRAYAVRFLKYNRSNILQDHVELPLTQTRISDSETFDMTVDSHFPEEKLFYAVSPGAMQAYRKSIESHVTHTERIGCSAPDEMETSAYDAAAAFDSEGTLYDEDDGDTSAYNMEAFESCKSSRFAQLKRKNTHHSYEIEPNQFVSQQRASVVKRPGNHLNVSIPTKRVRSASRRVISPLNAVGSGSFQVPIKPDASSGDTNSYQDDKSTQRGGFLLPNNLEVDSAEVSTKPKKRKMAKHLSADYEGNWHVDSTFRNDQFERDHLKKRSDSHHLKSNGNIGSVGQPLMKKPKLVRHDSSFDNIAPVGGSASSPAASQMSNMPNPNKIIKILGGRERLRKEKGLKSRYGELGSGSPWSDFEDQALVVLVHDLGPNWELVSDALNSTSRFKCIFRKAKECKDRHSFLMDRNSGDGADSAEDSGSSQAYPSTLPGIPKGTARQLFQRLQGPVERDALIFHFEKIKTLMQKQHYRKSQDPKPLQTPHSSHALALSQVCPNNLNGPILTPLDLCDSNPSGPEIPSMGYQGLHPSGLAAATQPNCNPPLPSSSSNPSLQGSQNAMVGSNFATSPGRLNPSTRHPVPRSSSLSAEEQQRLQMYNQIISGRNMSSPGGASSPRTLPGGNGMRMVGINGNLPIVRHGLQGASSSPSKANPGNVVSSGMSSSNIPSGFGPNGHSSSVLRPREPPHTLRPGFVPEQQRQVVAMPEHGNNQGVSQFSGVLNASPPVSSYAISHPISHQQPHHVQGPPPPNHSNSQQQAYAMRLAKERQMQQRFLHQQRQQQQYGASSSLASNLQPRPQLPMSSPMQSSPQVQPQASSPAALSSMNAMPQHMQKPIAPNPVVVRGVAAPPGSSSLASQGGKQRQKPQANNRQHPQQRTQLQAQQGKVVKGVGRGTLTTHHNIPIDSSLNGVSSSTNLGTQHCEKGEPGTNVIMQSQLTSATSAVSPVLPPSRQYMGASPPADQSLPTHKLSSLPKNLKSTSHSMPVSSVGDKSLSSLSSSAVVGPYQKTASNQRLPNQNQAAVQRVAPPNSQVNSGPTTKSPSKDPNLDRHSASSSSAMDPATQLPQASHKAASPAIAHQWHASEQLTEPNAVNSGSNLSSIVQARQGHSQKPAPGSIPLARHEISEQWQQQQPHSPVVNQSPQQQKQPLQRTISQQPVQLQQGESGSLYGRSDDPVE